MIRMVTTAVEVVGLSSFRGITPYSYPVQAVRTFASILPRQVCSNHAEERHAEALSRCRSGLHPDDEVPGRVDRQGPGQGGRHPAEAGAEAGRRPDGAKPEEH